MRASDIDGLLHHLVEADQVPIQTADGRDDVDHLLLEHQIGYLAIVPGDRNVAGVDGAAKPLQQTLGDAQAEAGTDGWIEIVPQSGGSQPGVAQAQRNRGAAEKALGHGSIGQGVGGDQGVGAGDEGAGLGISGVPDLQETGDDRIEIGDRGAGLRDHGPVVGATAAGLARRAGGDAGSLSGLGRSARRALAHSGGCPAQQTAGSGAKNARVGDLGAVALQLDIQIVLQRQGDRVL